MMTKKNSKVQQILAGNVKMDTCTSFYANGDVNILPCPWEYEKQVTDGGRRQPKGRMTIEEDGTSFFRAYRHNSGSRYEHLFMTANGELKRTKRHLIVKLVLPIGISRLKVIETLLDQMQEMVHYIQTLKEQTIWK